MSRFKNLLKKFLPPPVNAFNREMSALDQRLLRLEQQILEQQQLLDKKLACLPEISGQLNQMKLAAKRTTPQARLSYFEFHIVDHCNLRCQGCVHFSCISEEHFVSVENIKKDLTRMTELLHGAVTRIGVMGGEPLLHPDVSEILNVTRTAFPDSIIELDTNGLLLLKMNDDFWKCCRDNDIVIVNTKYPINQNYEEMQKVAKDNDVQFRFFGNTGEMLKTSWKLPLDLKGRQDPIHSFLTCHRSNACTNLRDGRLYTCPVQSNIHIFNKKFGTRLELDPADYLDIYEAQSADEVLTFLSRPKPFCRYCMVNKQNFNLPWGQSNQEMSEWLPDGT